MKNYIGVYSYGGIITHVEAHDTLKEAVEAMQDTLKDERFNPEEDDARVFKVGEDGGEKYSYDPSGIVVTLDEDAKFPAVSIFISPLLQAYGVNNGIPELEFAELIKKHITGSEHHFSDEGDAANEEAILTKDKVTTVHTLRGIQIIITTDLKRKSTTLLLAEELLKEKEA